MRRIGLLSDTHGFIDDWILTNLGVCDEIWHAGDIGHIYVAGRLAALGLLRAVHGNIDGHDVRISYPESLRFTCEEVRVWIKHIGGYPGNYDRSVKQGIRDNPPDLFISGHSHILKVMHDNNNRLLHINPGAAGKYGIHQVRTMVRFVIDGSDIKDLEVIEKER